MKLPPLHVEEVVSGKRPKPPRAFHLERVFDGAWHVIAVGVEWPSGRVAMEWQTRPGCIAIFNDAREVRTVHGHGRYTRFVWDDESGGGVDGS